MNALAWVIVALWLAAIGYFVWQGIINPDDNGEQK